MKTAIAIGLSAGALWGCTSEGGDGTAGAAGAAGGAGGGCPAGSHDGASGACESSLTVTRSATAIVPARDHHTTLVVTVAGRPYLYVTGGGTDENRTIFADVQRAPIAADGSLGAFETIGALPEPRLGHATVLIEGRLIVVGGLTGGGAQLRSLPTTAVGTLADDGTIESWADGPKLPVAVMHHTCDAHGRRIYCVGGRITGNRTTDQAVSTELSADGALSAFSPVTPLAGSIGFHQSFVAGEALYVAGGLRRDTAEDEFEALRSVTRAAIAADGSLGPWTAAGELPASIHAGAAQPFLGRVYFVGGMDHHGDVRDTILVASIGPDGTLGPAVDSGARLSSARMHLHQAPMHERWIYAVAGRGGDGTSSGVVDVGVFE